MSQIEGHLPSPRVMFTCDSPLCSWPAGLLQSALHQLIKALPFLRVRNQQPLEAMPAMVPRRSALTSGQRSTKRAAKVPRSQETVGLLLGSFLGSSCSYCLCKRGGHIESRMTAMDAEGNDSCASQSLESPQREQVMPLSDFLVTRKWTCMKVQSKKRLVLEASFVGSPPRLWGPLLVHAAAVAGVCGPHRAAALAVAEECHLLGALHSTLQVCHAQALYVFRNRGAQKKTSNETWLLTNGRQGHFRQISALEVSKVRSNAESCSSEFAQRPRRRCRQ